MPIVITSCLRSATLPLSSVDSRKIYHYVVVVNAIADMEQEALKQIQRDLQTQVSRELGQCMKCRKVVNVTIDGRCLGCYNARTLDIFGCSPLVTLPIPV